MTKNAEKIAENQPFSTVPAAEIPQNPENSEKITEAEALSRVVEESRAKIAESEPLPVKRKRGRPRKIYPTTEFGAVTPENNNPASADAVTAAPPMPEVDHRPGLKLLAGMAGTEIIAATGCDALAFSEDEQNSIAENGNIILKALFPGASDFPPELIAGMALAVLAYSKLQIYRAWQKEQEKKSQAHAETVAAPAA